MILTIGSPKGGVGKTTLAVNFAVALANQGQDVLLVDGDEQGHSRAFTDLRRQARPESDAGYSIAIWQKDEIRTEVRRARDRHQQIVIDVGGRVTASLRAALIVSDLVIIPTTPRGFDLWGSESAAEVITQIREEVNPKLRALAVINLASPRGGSGDEAQSYLDEIKGIDVSAHRIVRRDIFATSLMHGRGILELTGSSPAVQKAQAEFMALFQSIYPSIVKKGRVA